MKKKFAFSLVELMISLIVISIVTAAFAPIVTKKLKTSDMSIGAASSDYIFDESVCNKSVSNCSVCVKDECVRCKIGYYLDNNECKSCINNCEMCTNSSSCQKCESGYFVDDTKCSKCPDTCEQCSSAAVCTVCKKDYDLKDGKCTEACSQRCEFCDRGACKKCVQGYKWDGIQCKACTQEDSIIILSSGLSVYKYNLGDECGPPMPNDVAICYYDQACPKGMSATYTCYKTSANVPRYDTLCRMADPYNLTIAQPSGIWHLPNKADFVKMGAELPTMVPNPYVSTPLVRWPQGAGSWCRGRNIYSGGNADNNCHAMMFAASENIIGYGCCGQGAAQRTAPMVDLNWFSGVYSNTATSSWAYGFAIHQRFVK